MFPPLGSGTERQITPALARVAKVTVATSNLLRQRWRNTVSQTPEQGGKMGHVKPAPTLQDVADLVGVNPRTVSRVVNREGGFSAATRDKVLAAVDELQYRPNRAARALMTQRTDTLGLVGGDLADPFFAELAAMVDRELTDRGRTMLFSSRGPDKQTQQSVLERLQSHAVDGIILFPAPDSVDQVRALVRTGLRVVLIDPVDAADDLPVVRSEIDIGARAAGDYLTRSGRSSIVMLGSIHTAPTNGAGHRERGFRQSLEQSSLPDDAWTVINTEPTMDGAHRAVRALLVERPDTDAIFANNDMMAIGALHALTELGRTVPGDVALIGYNDLRISSETQPALTTVRIDREAVAHAAVQLLCDTPDNTAAEIAIPTELVIRDSA